MFNSTLYVRITLQVMIQIFTKSVFLGFCKSRRIVNNDLFGPILVVIIVDYRGYCDLVSFQTQLACY